MKRKMKKISVAAALLSAASVPAFAQSAEPACPFYENRSGLCGYYKSEISPSQAYFDAVVKKDRKNKNDRDDDRGGGKDGTPDAVILDVRSLVEYRSGHPEGSFNVPYPYLHQYCDAQGRTVDGACKKSVSQVNQDPRVFVEYVQKLFPNKNTPIYTLCRTGVRSVGAANLLTDAGYTNVRNIWEGFVGIYLTAPKVQADGSVKSMSVDLNHDGVLDDNDKNGWRYHYGLPFETRLKKTLVYKPAEYMYSWE